MSDVAPVREREDELPGGYRLRESLQARAVILTEMRVAAAV
jgi:hypothetical protein